MKNWQTMLICLLFVAIGAGGVIVAQRQGWLGGSDQAASPSPPAASADTKDHCEHQIPQAKCPFCTPSLVESMGFCSGHGVAEAYCTRCQDYLIPAFKAKGDWCGEHSLPESQCTICNPDLKLPPPPGASEAPLPFPDPSEFEATLQRFADAALEDPDTPRSMRAPSVRCEKTSLLITFESPQITEVIDLKVQRVRKQPISKTLSVNCQLDYDRNRYAQLASIAPGVIRSVKKDRGDEVQAGDVLAIVDSSELAAAKADYLQALAMVELWEKNHERETQLLEQAIGTIKDQLEAQTKLAEARIAAARARQRLASLGLDAGQIDAIVENNDTGSLLPLTAPFAGTVVEKSAVAGMVVKPDAALYAVADLSKVWAILEVYEADIADVRLNQPVTVKVGGLRDRTFAGRITWIDTRLDARTRTLKVRAEIDNAAGVLKANMFGEATIAVHDREPMLIVPKAAVQWEGCCNIVFVQQSETVFQPRQVYLGHEMDGHFAVRGGFLEEGDSVVTQGSFLLKTEILRGSIGAGCCEHNPAASNG